METEGIDVENRYTYFQPFPRLEHLATLSVSLEIWNYRFTQCYSDSSSTEHQMKKVNKIIDDTKVPKLVKEKIKTLCASVKQKMDDYRYQDIIKICNCAQKRDFFPYGAVWNPNGTINGRKTAEKALSCPRRLNKDDLVFTIIAKYCLENHVQDFSISSLSSFFIAAVKEGKYSHHEITNLWLKFKERSTVDGRISFYNTRNIDYQSTLRVVLNSMKDLTKTFEWSAYEYFWNYFDENDQVLIAEKLIRDSDNDKELQMLLFSKMSRCQLKRLYLQEPFHIILNFLFLEEFELAKAAWEYVKSTITGDDFESLIEYILMCENLTKNCIPFLIDAWNSAPDNLIEYVISVQKCAVLTIFFDYKPTQSSSSFEFLSAFLYRTTPECKLEFLLDNGPNLIRIYSHNVYNLLSEHCSNLTGQIENLLIEELESKSTEIMRRFSYVLFSSLVEFNKLLTFFTSKLDLQMRFKEHLLRSGILISAHPWYADIADKWAKLSQFIDELYSDQKIALSEKKNAVLSLLRSQWISPSCNSLNDGDNFTEIDNVSTQILTPEEIVTAKENIINQFRTVYTNSSSNDYCGSLSRMNMAKFTSWCYCNDQKKISQFKRSFPLNVLFRSLLRELVERYIDGKDSCLLFAPLGELLTWRFSSSKVIETFKMGQLYGIMRNNEKKSSDRKIKNYLHIVELFIKWVFDGDQLKIRKFQRLYNEHDKMKIIDWIYVECEETRLRG